MLLLLLATMPVVWTDGGKMKLYSTDKGFLVKPGVPRPNGTIPDQSRVGSKADPKLTDLCKWLGRESLPADLLAALQESAPNASSSEVATPVDHSPGVRAEHTNR